MNKQDILNLTGLSEQEFYSQYPDQASFCNAYPDACNQLNARMQMGGQQDQQQQLMGEISSMLKQGVNPKKILQQLVKMGMDSKTAMQMIQAVAQEESGEPNAEIQQQEQGEQVAYEDGGIHINPKNEGKFTESANRAGMGVQEFAAHVLANKEDYSSTQVKRANFARNAAKWHHEDGGAVMMDDSGIMKYGGIHIKKSHEGKFTEWANRHNMSMSEAIQAGKHSSDPHVRKMATFADNARKWKHQDGGNVYQNGGYYGYDGKHHDSKGSGTYYAGTYFQTGGGYEQPLQLNTIPQQYNPFGFYNPNVNVDTNSEVSPFTTIPQSNVFAPQNNAVMVNKNMDYKVDSPIAPQVTSSKSRNRFGKTMNNIATGLNVGINLTGVASNLYDQTKQNKEFNKYMQSKMSTMGQYGPLANAVNSSKGDYSITGSSYGQLRPDQMGQFSNSGMYNGVYYPGMAEYGAEIMQVGGLAGSSSEKYINRGTIPTPLDMMGMPTMAPIDNVGRIPYPKVKLESETDRTIPNFGNYIPNPCLLYTSDAADD